MSVLVIGATSQIGHFLLQSFPCGSQNVIALSRRQRPVSAHPVTWLVGELPDRMPAITQIESIVSFGPLHGLAAWLSRIESVRGVSLVATSSMSVESKRDSCLESERAISHRLLAGEDAVIAQCERLAIRWTILRPTMIYGVGLDKNLTPIAKKAMRWRLFPIPKARGLRQPVHAEDVASAAMRALTAPLAAGRVIALGGGERLSVTEMFRRVRNSLPVTTLPVTIPGPALQGLARVQSFYRGPLLRLESDLVADNSDAVAVLGIKPRPFHPTPDTWGLSF